MGAPGCDDAPHTYVGTDGRRHGFTLILPYYENPVFLTAQMRRWSRYPREVATRIQLIVVDDGSPDNPAAPVLRDGPDLPFVSVRCFRIEVDVRWNWLAARNIGAHEADDGWLMLTDMDHVLPPVVADRLTRGTHDPEIIYRFSRFERGVEIHPHPNSWFMTRRMFWRVGGYDEALSGHYGTDGEYRRRCAATAPIRILSDALERREHELDSSTTRYRRKQPEDARAKQLIRGRGPDWRPQTLSFPYKEVVL